MTRSIVTWHALALGAVLAILGAADRADAQVIGGGGFVQRSVGGVSVDALGVLEAPTVDDQRELAKLRDQVASQAPADLEKLVDLRSVSLKHVEAELAKAAAHGTMVPDEVRYLAGLQRVEYVFIYPEKNDVVIAGPAEGWKVDQLGNVVGQTTNRPVLLLDDLIVALRSGAPSRLEAITCSIDPSAEGLQRVQAVVAQILQARDRDEQQAAAAIEDALGPQTISVTGVPATSHFARAMVAADFRMKRLAMNFEPAPVDGMPSYLKMHGGRGRGMSNMNPRWWLAANYQPLAKSGDSLAWQLRGPGVKCMTEEDYVSESGQIAHSGKANPKAKQWADSMTKHFDELAAHDSAFGAVRNIMDLAVIGALVEKEQLAQIAGFAAPQLMGEAGIAAYPAPRTTSTKASLIRAGSSWVISASGGVEMLPWNVADKTEVVASVAETRTKFAAATDALWHD